ncbi:MAG: DUF4126 domain-containing protein [candidate division WOR-3 bacterium]|nr:MAG: DUF4126 domain-containing protein [candidate division WOR-3 bacterium]
MDCLLHVLLGIGLAAACGFRVFVPLLVICIAAISGVSRPPRANVQTARRAGVPAGHSGCRTLRPAQSDCTDPRL